MESKLFIEALSRSIGSLDISFPNCPGTTGANTGRVCGLDSAFNGRGFKNVGLAVTELRFRVGLFWLVRRSPLARRLPRWRSP